MARILVVDDSAVHLAAYEQILANKHQVTTAADGKRALDLLQEQTYDLLITDVIMPDVSGFELIEHVRDSCADLKIIAVTGAFFPGADSDEFLHVAQNQGADEVLAKPFEPQQLAGAVDKLLT